MNSEKLGLKIFLRNLVHKNYVSLHCFYVLPFSAGDVLRKRCIKVMYMGT